jgi:phage terminase large subunit
MNNEPLVISKFFPRNYQLDLCQAFEEGKYKKFLLVWPRRAGKDICSLNLLLRAACRRVGNYFFCLPTYRQARSVIWDCIDNDGNRILKNFIPDELVESRNEMFMRIRLKNGSQIQLIGSDSYDKSLVGSNAAGIVFSEYAISDEKAYMYSIPILKASQGWVLINSTPRGKNQLWDLYISAKKSKDWFCEKLTLEVTKHISKEEIEKEIEEGKISRDLAEQEFSCSFDMGAEGSIWGKAIDSIRFKGQITNVLWDPSLLVHTAWDLGYSDPTCLIFAQYTSDKQLRIIDYYEKSKEDMSHFVKYMNEKPYTYGKHILPFDVGNHEQSSGITRRKALQDLGVKVVLYNEKPMLLDDQIEAVRRTIPRVWIDDKKCEVLIRALENYRQEYDSKHGVYSIKPVHDKFSHGASAMRYLCSYLPKLQNNCDPEELDRRYQESRYSNYNDHTFY